MKKLTAIAAILAATITAPSAMAIAPDGYASSATIGFDINVPGFCGVKLGTNSSSDYTEALTPDLTTIDQTADEADTEGFAVAFADEGFGSDQFKPLNLELENNSSSTVRVVLTDDVEMSTGFSDSVDHLGTIDKPEVKFSLAPEGATDGGSESDYDTVTQRGLELSEFYGKRNAYVYLDMDDLNKSDVKSGFYDKALTVTLEITCD